MKASKQTTIFTLLELGKSQREIERVTGIDRKTIRSYQHKFQTERANSPVVATGGGPQIRPSRPPAELAGTSACEPWLEFIEAQLRLNRNATAIYQDLVDQHGLQSDERLVRRSRHRCSGTELRLLSPGTGRWRHDFPGGRATGNGRSLT